MGFERTHPRDGHDSEQCRAQVNTALSLKKGYGRADSGALEAAPYMPKAFVYIESAITKDSPFTRR
jgi:hypothetical protein